MSRNPKDKIGIAGRNPPKDLNLANQAGQTFTNEGDYRTILDPSSTLANMPTSTSGQGFLGYENETQEGNMPQILQDPSISNSVQQWESISQAGLRSNDANLERYRKSHSFGEKEKLDVQERQTMGEILSHVADKEPELEDIMKKSLQNLINLINDFIEAFRLEDPDISQSKKSLETALENHKYLQKSLKAGREERRGKYSVEAVSFSKLKKKHMEYMGVKLFSTSYTPESFALTIKAWINEKDFVIPRITRNRPQETEASTVKLRDCVDEWLDPSMEGMVHNIQRNILVLGQTGESMRRTLIDPVLITMVEMLHTKADFVSLAFLELTLASSQGKSEPVEIGNTSLSRSTLLTGSVDYAIFTLNKQKARLKKVLATDSIDEFLETWKRQSSLDGVLADEQLMQIVTDKDGFGLQVTIVEAKSQEFPDWKLENCEPQAVGEALVIMRKFKRDVFPWCLTNGLEYIFGLVVTQRGKRVSGEDFKSYRLPPISILKGKKVDEKMVKIIFEILTCWAVADSMELKKIFKKDMLDERVG